MKMRSSSGQMATLPVILLTVLGVGAALATHVRGEAPAPVPFAFVHNEVIVQVLIDGKGPYAMMLDTDTDPSVVSLALARSSGFTLRRMKGDASGGGTGHPDLYLTRLRSVALGGVAAKDLQAVAIDLSELSARLGTEIHGVIGHDFLSGRVLQIDYPNRTVRLEEGSPTPADGSRAVATLPFHYNAEHSCLVIEGILVNGKKVTATLDTGSDGTFKLTPAAVEFLGLSEAARTGRHEESIGYNGAAQNTLGRLDDIVIGTLRVPSPDVVFFGKGTGRDHKPWGLNIGNAFLRAYVVTVDYRRKLVVLERPVTPDK